MRCSSPLGLRRPLASSLGFIQRAKQPRSTRSRRCASNKFAAAGLGMRVTKTGVTKLFRFGLIAVSLAAGACSSGTASEKGPAAGGGGRGGGRGAGGDVVPVTVAVVERKP